MKKNKIIFCLLIASFYLSSVWCNPVVGNETESQERMNISDEFDKEARAGLQFLLLLLILWVCHMATIILEKYHLHYLPESGAFIIIGIIVGAVIYAIGASDSVNALITFNSSTFWFILLPPIIFESGFSLKKLFVFANFGAIMTYAIFGTLISTAVFAGGIWFLNDTFGWGLRPLETLVFGSLISATDPVAALAIFTNVKTDRTLTALVLGESLINDAVAIVLFRTFMLIIDKPSDIEIGVAVLGGVRDFFIISLGSLGVGVALGLISAIHTRFIRISPGAPFDIAVLAVYAYTAYLLGEGLELSGIVSIFFCAVIMNHYTKHNLSKESKEGSLLLFKFLATMSETYVFVYLGLSIWTFKFEYSWSLIGVAFGLCILGRIVNIFPLSGILNICRKQNINFRSQLIMCFAGLRGAIAYSLAISVPTNSQGLIISTTHTIILITVFLFGSGTGPLLKLLKIPTAQDDIDEPVTHQLVLEKKRKQYGRLHSLFHKFDQRVVLPLLRVDKKYNKHSKHINYYSQTFPEDTDIDINIQLPDDQERDLLTN